MKPLLIALWQRVQPVIKDEAMASSKEAWALFKEASDWFQRHSGWLLLGLSGSALAIALFIYPNDQTWLTLVRASRQSAHGKMLSSLAGSLSLAGDFQRLNAGLVLGFVILARMTHKQRWRRLAMVCLLSAALSGLAAVSMRFMLGRARPIARMNGGFYGPDLRTDYQGCPSGHTATAFGAAVPLVIADPLVGVPVIALASGVAWSRLYLNKHYPTDIAAGLWVAIMFGIPFGWVARRGNRTP